MLISRAQKAFTTQHTPWKAGDLKHGEHGRREFAEEDWALCAEESNSHGGIDSTDKPEKGEGIEHGHDTGQESIDDGGKRFGFLQEPHRSQHSHCTHVHVCI